MNVAQSFIFALRNVLVVTSIVLGVLLASSHASADDHKSAAKSPSFEIAARPVLTAYCVKCHGTSKHKGKVDFSLASDDASARRQRKLWRKAIEQIETKEMPPEEEKQPTPDERLALLDWMKGALAQMPDPADRDPGPGIVRRLSLAEYNNTVRDLLDVQFDAGEAAGMTDESGNGNNYGNLAAALDVPPALMEKYFVAADKLLDRLFGTEFSSRVDDEVRDRARRSRERLFSVKEGAWAKPDAIIKAPDGATEHDAARGIISGFLGRAYRGHASTTDIEQIMAVYDYAAGKGEGYVASVRLALKAVLVSPRFLYRIEEPQERTASNQPYRVAEHDLATRLSYFLWSAMPDEQLAQLADDGKLSASGPSDVSVKLGGDIIGSADTADARHRKSKAFDGDPYTFYEGPDAEGDWVGLDLGAPRPLTQIRYMGYPLYNHSRQLIGGKFQASTAEDFSREVTDLFTVEKQPPPGEMVRVDVAVPGACRYVRFLSAKRSRAQIAEMQVWGKLDGTPMEQQVRRMLADPKARALTDNFAAHWLQINRLPAARPSTEFFPDFNTDVRKAAYDETATFFEHLRTEDRTLLDLLDADYTWLNEDLAKYYKIPDVKGKEMRRVALKPDYHRGGLLGMGSVLAMTSASSRTSPTLRGKYVLDVIFGTPPAPPPADAGMFKDEADKARQPATFRERMARHAANPTCAACHKKMDPLGYAMENYNAAGQWRDDDHGKPLDTGGELPTGEKLTGAADLKRIILQRKDQFVRNVIEQTLVYALGRELDEYDDPAVRQIQTRMEHDGYRFSSLILGVVESYPFQYRRGVESQAP